MHKIEKLYNLHRDCVISITFLYPDFSSCGINAGCSILKHRKQCTCPEGFTGNAEVECVRIPNTCLSDQACPSSMICPDGICMLACRSDDDCASNERCSQGQCKLTCKLDNDCFLGHVCLGGVCSVGCKTASDCPTSQSCVGNKCSDPCGQESCGPNAQCTVVDQRAQCSCLVGFLPNPTAVIGCAREPTTCVSENQCPKGFQCHAKFCRPLCNTDDACLSHELCIDNVCQEICKSDNECRSNEICQGVKCVPGTKILQNVFLSTYFGKYDLSMIFNFKRYNFLND